MRIGTTVLLLTLSLSSLAEARTLRVGPERNYKHIRDVAMVAGDGDVILLDPGIYTADVATWTQNDLVIWAPDGRARFIAGGASADDKGIWLVQGRNFTAENIEFTGARVPDHNGAGVRIHAKGKVTLRNCYFHHNELGVLGDADEILIDRCTFDQNGAGDQAHNYHNIYIWGPKVTVQQSYVHRPTVGHNIKSRAETTYILGNRIMDEQDGTGSYAIDVPDCGTAYIIGNVIEQGPRSVNYHLISYGAESDNNTGQELYLINNTLINNGRPDGIFLKIRKRTYTQITNNIFYGPGTPWVGGDVTDSHNYIDPSLDNAPRFLNPGAYDFHLTAATSRAIVDGAIAPGASSTGYDLTPMLEYVYDANGRARPTEGPLDLGAFEFVTPRPAATAAPDRSKTATMAKKKAKTFPARSTKKPPAKSGP